MDVLIYYKFRYTFQNLELKDEYSSMEKKQHILNVKGMLNDLDPYIVDRCTVGLEYMNSYGAPTHPHMHIHFTSRSKKDTIIKQLRRRAQEYGETMRTNKVFSLKPETYVVEEKFFRYPLKQGLNIDWQKGFKEEEYTQMHLMANDCWKIGCEVNNSKKDRKEESTDLYDRLYRHVIKELKNEICDINVLAEIIKFYQIEKRPINMSTAKGYMYTVLLDSGKITPLDLAKQNL